MKFAVMGPIGPIVDSQNKCPVGRDTGYIEQGRIGQLPPAFFFRPPYTQIGPATIQVIAVFLTRLNFLIFPMPDIDICCNFRPGFPLIPFRSDTEKQLFPIGRPLGRVIFTDFHICRKIGPGLCSKTANLLPISDIPDDMNFPALLLPCTVRQHFHKQKPVVCPFQFFISVFIVF